MEETELITEKPNDYSLKRVALGHRPTVLKLNPDPDDTLGTVINRMARGNLHTGITVCWREFSAANSMSIIDMVIQWRPRREDVVVVATHRRIGCHPAHNSRS